MITILHAGKTFPNLPTGTHGKKAEVERGHVRKMARHFGIMECAEEYLKGF